VAALVALVPSAAWTDEGTEAGVKAAYLYKFMAYVEWPGKGPDGLDAPQVIGVVGADAVATELQQVLTARKDSKNPLVARKLNPGEAPSGVDVLYLGRGVSPGRWLAAVAGRPVLVVTDEPGGLPEGSALNFVLVGRRLRFEASPSAAERAGLRLSARLLAVAERIIAP
jgi:YfiR/HmsC-like